MAEKLQAEGLKAAIEKTKQIITLSTGVITLTVTFFDKFGSTPTASRALPWTLFVAWGFFGLAIVSAVLTLGAITGTLDCIDKKTNGLKLDDNQENAIIAMTSGKNIRFPALAMELFFLFAMGLTIASGLRLT